ncbi:MAG: hypothetical protein GY798_31820 [Hyphomicrobiales bacterium]|nr:hypothetical protein [Hyphomicrobiales bacterium]
MSPRLRSAALGSAALYLTLGAGQAFAADATEVADAIVAAMQANGDSQAKYESASASGDAITVAGFSATNKDGSVLSAPAIVITGAEMRDQGGFTADDVTFDDGKVVDNDSVVSWQAASVSNPTVPSADEIKAKTRMSPFSAMELAGLSIEGDDLPVPLTIESVNAVVDIDDEGNPRDFDVKIADIGLAAEIIGQEPEMAAVLGQLGYGSGFIVDLDMAGAYETDGDIFTLRNFTLDAADVGTLNLAGKIIGVSPGKIADTGRPDQAAADGLLDNLTIRFDNAGVVERVLDMQAQQMGMPREDFVAQITGGLPFMLNVLGNPAFQEKVAAAADTFLKDPKSITLTLTPPAPVKFMDIGGAAMSAPQTLVDTLAADISANN